MRLIVPLILCLLAGCSLFGEDYTDLAPGTFRMEADREDLAGTASYFRDRSITVGDSVIVLDPTISLQTDRGDLMTMKSGGFFDVTAGNQLVPDASYEPAAGGDFLSEEGSVRITYADSVRIAGTFRFRMRTYDGLFSNREITVEGGFNATRAE